MDRKEIVKTLSEVLGSKPTYLGAPTFAYEIKTEKDVYRIGKDGVIRNSEYREVTLEEILFKEQEDTLDNANIEMPFKDHTGRTLINILNMLYSKQHLIVEALELDEILIDKEYITKLNQKKIETIEELKEAIYEAGPKGCNGIDFNFEEETFSIKLLGKNLNEEKISALMKLTTLISENAKKLKYASFKEAQDDNPKYAFRTWLIRLGMNGREYKEDRKILLKNLKGNSAFREPVIEGSAEIEG
ncbi:virulence-related protein [Caloramator sp. mosi_1]|uniref:virulence-related protein n=1 Tax=Caloramator sp. mosi_1 TaxID=3023090 RepID=UPI00235EB200|nr:virulence-related protein [Caloramator sp. mosi_1]WDC83318.1 virulence-related protein [Caloramator sp. mosi_1]